MFNAVHLSRQPAEIPPTPPLVKGGRGDFDGRDTQQRVGTIRHRNHGQQH
jgi:hypothetical protein